MRELWKWIIGLVLGVVIITIGLTEFFIALEDISPPVVLVRIIGIVCSLVTMIVGLILFAYCKVEIEVARVKHNDKRNI